MWGMEPNKLSSSIGARLPVRINKDTRYFTDEFKHCQKMVIQKWLVICLIIH